MSSTTLAQFDRLLSRVTVRKWRMRVRGGANKVDKAIALPADRD